MTLRTVGVRLTAEIGEYQSKLKAAAQSTRDFSGELDRAAKKGNLDRLTTGTAVLGAGLVGVAAGAVKMRMDFDTAMSAVSAATHAPAADLEQLRLAAVKAGKDTQFSATDAADAITELSKAGVKTKDILGGGLAGALSLAAAGQLGVGDAAETAASALSQFNLKGAAVPHVADLLAAAAGKAQGSVHDVGEALNQSGLVASQFGLSIEDTTGVLAEFANAGLVGSDAGTSFRTMLLAMANPSKQTTDAMKSLGISFYDAQGKFVGLGGVAQVLQGRLKGLSDEQRQATLAQVFGTDAIRAASILYADGAKGVDQWKGAVNQSGYASETAAKLTDNLSGDLERLKGSLETVAIQSGGGAAGGLRSLAQGANSAVNAFGDLPDWIQRTLTVLSGVGGATLLAAAGFLKARGTAKDFLDELRDMGPKAGAAADKIGKIGSVAGKLTLVGTAAVGVYEGMKLFGDWIEHFSDPTARDVDKMTDALREFASTGRVTGELAKTFGADMQGLTRDLDAIQRSQEKLRKLNDLANGPAGTQGRDRAIAALGGSIKDMSAQARTDIDALDETLAKLVTGGNVTAAKIAFDNFARSTGLSLAQLPKYAQATQGAALASSGLANGFGDAASNAHTMTRSLESAISAGQKLTDVWSQLHGALLSSDRAALSARESIDAVKKSFQDNKRAVDGNSEAALRNRVAVGDAAEAAAKAAQAKYEETGSLKDANKVYDGYIDQLKKTLHQAHLTDGQIKTLIGAYAKMPPTVETKVSVTGDKAVESKLAALQHQQLVLAAGPTAAAAQTATENYYKYRTKKATGGPIYGPGTGTSDSIPALLSDGEYVIKASSVKRVGLSNLDVINQQGRLPPAYAGGGAVWPFPVDASKTKVPSLPPAGGAGPGGGQTYHWILDVVRRAFPGLHATSTFRAGAVTLSGNRSYHAVGRAVDFPPSMALAQWVNANYFRATRELITPWNSLNIRNGSRHTYTGDVFAQHAGTGRFKGNAHDHWAMARGGVIPEHVVGVGRSGRTYEFGELGPERVTPLRGYATGGLVNVARTASSSGSRLDTADAMLSAASAVAALTAALKANGRAWSTATQKGRDNRSALIAGVKAAQDAAKAKYDETGSIKAANRVYDEYVHKLDESMKKMHVNAATRRELIKAYSERPKYDTSIAAPSNSGDLIKATTDHIGIEDSLQSFRGAVAWTKPTFDLHTESGRSELGSLFGFLNAASSGAQSMYEYTGNAKQATAYYQGYISQLRSILIKSGMSAKDADALIKRYGRITLTPKSNRWGGLYEHAATGSLRDAQIAAGGPTQYAWAESSTGGELFAPKNGNLQKTRQEVGWAVANWWGGNVNWGGQGAGKNVTVQATIPITLGAETITQQVEMVVDTALGKVVNAIVYQSA